MMLSRFLSFALALNFLGFSPTPASQSNFAFAQVNQTQEPLEPAVSGTAEDFEQVFKLALKVESHKILYPLLNKTFSENVQVINARGNGLSITQLIFILMNLKHTWPDLERYLEQVPSETAESAKAIEARQRFRPIFDKAIADLDLIANLKAQNDPTQALVLRLTGEKLGFDQMRLFANHPLQENPDDPKSKLLRGHDLRQLVIDFMAGSEQELMYNVFDFDLDPIADALISAKSRGVTVTGGIDKKTYEERPAVKKVIDRLLSQESETFQTNLVNSVGLNHQKIILRDPFGPNAAIMFLSGNFTQSCLGPEGDAIDLPRSQRPKGSIPNSNHAVVVRGQLPALVARFELRKTFEHQLRGQSEYPPGGAFKIHGPIDSVRKVPSWIIMAFSPNGGLGDVNRDILSRLFTGTEGTFESLTFAFSSVPIRDAAIARTKNLIAKRRAEGKPVTNLLRMVGDPPFTMREWSVPLNLSGLDRSLETKIYSEISDAPLRTLLTPTEYENWRSNIRVANRIYGERHIKLKDGTSRMISAKIHDKVFIFPEAYIAMVGTSFNPSKNAESNNEQVLIVRDSSITHQARQMLAYHFFRAQGSVHAVAMKRNCIKLLIDEPPLKLND